MALEEQVARLLGENAELRALARLQRLNSKVRVKPTQPGLYDQVASDWRVKNYDGSLDGRGDILWADEIATPSPPVTAGGGGTDGPPLPPAGGGGTSGGMEPRIARLESDMEHVKRSLVAADGKLDGLRGDVNAIKIDVAVIREKLTQVPTIGQMWTAAIGIVGVLGGIVALIVRFVPHAP